MLKIPKIFHRIWIDFNPKKPGVPALYKEFDVILKNLHKDWQVMEWNDNNIKLFIQGFYPDFLPTYLSYDVPVKKHDAARYLIIKQYGGVFIQHSIKLQKNLEPLLDDKEIIFSKQSHNHPYQESIGNSFFASVPNHNFWKDLLPQLSVRAKLFVLDATGPSLLTETIDKYLKKTGDLSLKILDSKYLYPFDWNEKHKKLLDEICMKDTSHCFELFPESYGYCRWKGSWLNGPEYDPLLYSGSQILGADFIAQSL